MTITPTESGAVFLAVRTSRHVCALPLSHVAEVMRPLPVEPLAGAAEGVRGLAVIRGRPTPVLDLGRVLTGEPMSATGNSRFVTLRVGQRAVALAVEAVLTVRTLVSARFDALPPLWCGPLPPAVSALGALDRELFLILETARLLPAETDTGGEARGAEQP